MIINAIIFNVQKYLDKSIFICIFAKNRFKMNYKLKPEVIQAIRDRADLKLALMVATGASRSTVHYWLEREDCDNLTRIKVLTAISRELGIPEMVLIEPIEVDPVLKNDQRGRPKKAFEKPKNPIFVACIDVYDQFIRRQTGMPAKINGTEGRAMKQIITYLKSAVKDRESEQAIVEAWQYIFANWHKIDRFLQGQLLISQINHNLINILNQLRNGQSKQPASQHTQDQVQRVLNGSL